MMLFDEELSISNEFWKSLNKHLAGRWKPLD